jgi:hypothetical protein
MNTRTNLTSFMTPMPPAVTPDLRFATFAALLLAVAVVGCGKPSEASARTTSRANETTPAVEAALAAWAQGDSAEAVRRFLNADWGARPVFKPDSTLGLSEDRFKALAPATREAKAAEALAQLQSLKKLAGAVAQAGRDAASRKDAALARKHFAALVHCGEALDTAESMTIVRLVGQALKKMAAAEVEKLPR